MISTPERTGSVVANSKHCIHTMALLFNTITVINCALHMFACISTVAEFYSNMGLDRIEVANANYA
jgi:hypothetical protein